MAQAKKEGNRRASALGVSSVLSSFLLRIKINPVTKGLIVKLTS